MGVHLASLNYIAAVHIYTNFIPRLSAIFFCDISTSVQVYATVEVEPFRSLLSVPLLASCFRAYREYTRVQVIASPAHFHVTFGATPTQLC